MGWHTRSRLKALTDHAVVPVGRSQWPRLRELARSADAVIHIAGINRAPDHDLENGNLQLARDLADAIRHSESLRTIVYANSTQSLNDSPYGRGKAKAADLLRDTAHSVGASFLDVILPNLFGEHGRSDYNSFVATFVHRVISEQSPTVQDKPITLLHAQDAAQALIDGLTASFGAEQLAPTSTATTVGEVLRTLKYQFGQYRSGDIPALASNLEVRLFNTLRAAMFQTYPPVPLHRHVDSRGSLVETVRAHGSEGQTFFSSTRPGVTRGQDENPELGMAEQACHCS
ncbi:NAD-dependent epimerase/dehydratase family protein [Georgenia sp. SUBG003]|uniref:NAD-dependent epimerase/dehydratase family protein n=1 Tax=Georgenia sp. SUBG003 TaxID=1497974 RepID=UPI003AB274CB